MLYMFQLTTNWTPSAGGSLSTCPTWSTRPMTGCSARSTSLWVHRNLFWQLSRHGNVRGSGMSHATTACPEPSLGHLGGWVMGAMVGRGNAGWTTSKSGHPADAKTAHKGHLQKRLEEDLGWIVPHVPPLTHLVKGLTLSELIVHVNYHFNSYSFDCTDLWLKFALECPYFDLIFQQDCFGMAADLYGGGGGFWWLFPRMRGFGGVFNNSFPTCAFFFKVEIRLHTLFPLFRPGSVHGGSASWDNCDWVFPDKLRVSLFPDRFPCYARTAA